MHRTNIRIFIATAILGCAIAPLSVAAQNLKGAAIDGSIGPNRVKTLEQQLSSAEKELADSQSKCDKLREALAEARGEANPPVNSGRIECRPSETVAILPVVKFGTPAGTVPVNLGAGLDGSTLELKSLDASLCATADDTSHLTLSFRKTSKALGTTEATKVGKLWLESGTLFLQWLPGDQSAAVEMLRYSVVVISSDSDKAGKVITFYEPAVTSLVATKTEPQRVAIPGALSLQAKLMVESVPTGWSTSSTDGQSVQVVQGAMKAQIKYDPRTAAVTVALTDPDPNHAKRRLDALNATYDRTQTELKRLQEKAATPPARTEGYWRGSLWYPPTVEDRSGLSASIHSLQETLQSSDKARPKLEAEVAASDQNSKFLQSLSELGLSLKLPNGLCAAKVTLRTSR